MRLTRGTTAGIALLVLLVIMTVYPLLTLLYGSFVKEGPLSQTTTFTLSGYKVAYLRPDNLIVLWNTIWLTAVRTVLAVTIGIFLAWMVTRTDTPWRRFIEICIWISLFVPLQPMVFAWIGLLSKKSGLINIFIRDMLPFLNLTEGPFNIYSYGGIIWTTVLLWSASGFVLISPAFRRMDASMEEAGRMAGSSRLDVFLRVTLPLMKPAVLGASILAFVRIVGSFEIEVFLGQPANIYVFTTKVYDYLNVMPARYPEAMSMSTVIQIITLLLVFTQWRLLGKTQYTSITGKGYVPRLTKLGNWRYLMLGLGLVYVLLTLVLPFGALAAGSFSKVFGVYQTNLLTLDNYRRIFSDSTIWSSLKNTILVGGIAATVGMVFYSLLSYAITRSNLAKPIRRGLDLLSWLPYSVPPITLALGFLWAFIGAGAFFPLLRPLAPLLYGSLFFMVIVSLVRPLPLGVRTMNASLLQLGNELEECSRIHGASWTHTFRHIVVPLISPAFVSTWIFIFLGVWRDLVTYILLYLPKSRLISITMFEYWNGGQVEAAVAIGTVTVLVAIPLALLAQWLGARAEGTASQAY